MEFTPSAEKNHWVPRYAKVITILGVLTMLWGAFTSWQIVRSALGGAYWMQQPWDVWIFLIGDVRVILFGFLMVGASRLLEYTIGTRQSPGWVLQKTSLALFILAVTSLGDMFLGFVQMYYVLQSQNASAHSGEVVTWWMAFLAGIRPLLRGIGGAFMFMAFGFTLRRVLPVIEESKGVV